MSVLKEHFDKLRSYAAVKIDQESTPPSPPWWVCYSKNEQEEENRWNQRRDQMRAPMNEPMNDRSQNREHVGLLLCISFIVLLDYILYY